MSDTTFLSTLPFEHSFLPFLSIEKYSVSVHSFRSKIIDFIVQFDWLKLNTFMWHITNGSKTTFLSRAKRHYLCEKFKTDERRFTLNVLPMSATEMLLMHVWLNCHRSFSMIPNNIVDNHISTQRQQSFIVECIASKCYSGQCDNLKLTHKSILIKFYFLKRQKQTEQE